MRRPQLLMLCMLMFVLITVLGVYLWWISRVPAYTFKDFENYKLANLTYDNQPDAVDVHTVFNSQVYLLPASEIKKIIHFHAEILVNPLKRDFSFPIETERVATFGGRKMADELEASAKKFNEMSAEEKKKAVPILSNAYGHLFVVFVLHFPGMLHEDNYERLETICDSFGTLTDTAKLKRKSSLEPSEVFKTMMLPLMLPKGKEAVFLDHLFKGLRKCASYSGGIALFQQSESDTQFIHAALGKYFPK